ncbi:hypothetical protein HNY73_004023 [Argiope bruennichi]|uniref:Uncharacterized protein n=1 Tax=Argiope bruennichi TaxID=94029 RepID=A0A8T0FSF4_ARGBR|nr:hypothetical protein HNY73_004023 [Argiope bruennichi]
MGMAELTLRNIRNKLWLNMRLLLVITAIAILFSPAVAIICIIIQQLRKILMLLETHDTIEARMESAIEKERRKRQKVSRPVYKKQIRFKSLSILTKNGTSTEQKPNNPNPCGILRKKAEEQPSHNFSEAPAKTTEIIKTSARKTSVSISSANIESRIEMERGKRNKESLPAYKKQESLKSSSTLTKKVHQLNRNQMTPIPAEFYEKKQKTSLIITHAEHLQRRLKSSKHMQEKVLSVFRQQE